MTGSRPLRTGEVWTRREGDETAVYDRPSGRLLRLNPSAFAIWELCDGETQIDEIVDAIVELTGNPRSEVATEVETTLTRLRALGLLIREEGAR
jgi:PqqD family protein of HPr-rel-A system